MALQMVRSFFGQGTPSRSRAHKPIIGIESLGNQEGNSSYDRGDVGKSAAFNWFELARHPTSELGGKPHSCINLDAVYVYFFSCRVTLMFRFRFSPYSPQWAEGICRGGDRTKLTKCKPWHNLGT